MLSGDPFTVPFKHSVAKSTRTAYPPTETRAVRS